MGRGNGSHVMKPIKEIKNNQKETNVVSAIVRHKSMATVTDDRNHESGSLLHCKWKYSLSFSTSRRKH